MELKVNNRKGEEFSILFDDEDYELVSGYTWSVNAYGYAVAIVKGTPRPQKHILMHRLILGIHNSSKPFVDHINGNRSDNRRLNIRTCTQSQNIQNSRKQIREDSSSKYKGVSYSTNGKRRKRWQATIKSGGSVIYLGRYLSEVDAAMAYDKAAIKYFGEFSKTNFTK